LKIVKEAEAPFLHAVLEGDIIMPCPFCGSSNIELNYLPTMYSAYHMQCECGVEVAGHPLPGKMRAEEEHLVAAGSALMVWNRRVEIGSHVVPIGPEKYGAVFYEAEIKKARVITFHIGADGYIDLRSIDQTELG